MMGMVVRALALLWLLSGSFVEPTLSASASCWLVYCDDPPPLPSHRSPSSSPQTRSRGFWAHDKLSGSWKQVDILEIIGNVSKFHPSSPSAGASSGEFGNRPDEGEKVEDQTAAEVQSLGLNSEVSLIEPVSALDFLQAAPQTQSFLARQRVSLVRFSDNSVWITGPSGSIYERFWNGVQWVIIPHDLPVVAGYAVGMFAANQTMLALSGSGNLYHLHVNIEGDILWTNCSPQLPNVNSKDISLCKSGMPSPDMSSLHFATTDGLLFELVSIHPAKWVNHGQPRGGDVAAVVDVGTLRPGAVFTVSSAGDLYEHDPRSKPPWKKHVRQGSSIESFPLEATSGATLHDLAGPSSTSLFLITKDGLLVERRISQSKWRWILHASPKDVQLSSIGPSLLDSGTGNTSIFCTSQNGIVFEYRLRCTLGNTKQGSNGCESGTWIDHKHPTDVAVLSSLAGLSLGNWRFLFALEDGRVGELHSPGQGGPSIGPMIRSPAGKSKQSSSYIWSVIEAPETEGGNAEYCTSDHGPANCLEGVNYGNPGEDLKVGVSSGKSSHWKRSSGRGRARKSNHGAASEADETTTSQSPVSGLLSPLNQSLSELFRSRTLQFNRSLFMVGDDGIVAEKYLDDDTWLWVTHEFESPIKGLGGTYNNSIYSIDINGYLLLLESANDQLQWLNCSALEGGTKVLSGRPWDGVLGESRVTTLDDALFFVGESGELFEFKVALRTFTWRNCGHPPATMVAAILDQEVLRHRVVYIVGMDGRLYHFNRVTSMWHSNKQPSDIVLSPVPGVVLRPNFQTTVGSLFIRAEDGSLVEYHWDHTEGWLWTRHKFPEKGVVLATAPGPSLCCSWIFVVGSNGRVYSRHTDENSKWVWADHGYPSTIAMLQDLDAAMVSPGTVTESLGEQNQKVLTLKGHSAYLSFEGKCNNTIAPVRPVAYASDTAMFLLDDGRLAELKQMHGGAWEWTSIVETPTGSCQSTYFASSE